MLLFIQTLGLTWLQPLIASEEPGHKTAKALQPQGLKRIGGFLATPSSRLLIYGAQGAGS